MDDRMAFEEEMETQALPEEQIEEITRDFEREPGIFNIANVVGVGAGTKYKEGKNTGEPAVKVLVSQKLPKGPMLSSEDLIPPQIGGTTTDVEEVGYLVAGLAGTSRSRSAQGGVQTTQTREPFTEATEPMEVIESTIPSGNGRGLEIPERVGAPATIEQQEATIQLLRSRVRPVEGGYSIGHPRVSCGTYATAVIDSRAFPGIPPKFYALSNNHVLAASNLGRAGDGILQPGRCDGGRYPADVIAHLSRWVPLRFGGPQNLVDAAIAEGPFQWLDREVYWIGYTEGVINRWPAIGQLLQKTGRTSNWTTGRVTAINATVDVGGYPGGWARFARQIVTTPMSAGGDSGSLVLDQNRNAVGLLFAGSAQATIMNHIVFVQNSLGIRVA